MAELVFADLIEKRGVRDRFTVTSCATSGYEIGNPIYPPARQTLRRHNIAGEHTARRITQEDISSGDYILVMDEGNLRDVSYIAGEGARGKIFKLCAFTDNPRDVADPYYTRDFERAYADILDGCTAFLDWALKHA